MTFNNFFKQAILLCLLAISLVAGALRAADHEVEILQNEMATSSNDGYLTKFESPQQVGARSANWGCWNKSPGDMHLILSDGIVGMNTFIPANDFPYDVSTDGDTIYCKLPPKGECDHCWMMVESVEISDYAAPNSWCYFLFTQTYGGVAYESFYVHDYQANSTIKLHNRAYAHYIMCHDEAEARKKRALSDRSAQAGCIPDNTIPVEYLLEFDDTSAGSTFETWIPADGQNHRLGQPNPTIRCSQLGQCNDCVSTATRVWLKSGPGDAHCDILFNESPAGGYVFSASVTNAQGRVNLPKKGVLAFITCYQPGQKKENWISKLQKREHFPVASLPAEPATDVETRDLSVKNDKPGCTHYEGKKEVAFIFGSSGYKIISYVPANGLTYAFGQPNATTYCEHYIEDEVKCAPCWSVISWMMVAPGYEKPNCLISLTGDMTGNGLLQSSIQAVSMNYTLASEMNLAWITCNPVPVSASEKRQSVEVQAHPRDIEAVESVAIIHSTTEEASMETRAKSEAPSGASTSLLPFVLLPVVCMNLWMAIYFYYMD